MTYEEILAAFESIDYETILSSFDDKLTLLEWLTKLNDALVNNYILEFTYCGYQANNNTNNLAFNVEIPMNNYGEGVKEFISELDNTNDYDNAITYLMKHVFLANGVTKAGAKQIAISGSGASFTAITNNKLFVPLTLSLVFSQTNVKNLVINGRAATYGSAPSLISRTFASNSVNRNATYSSYIVITLKNASGIVFSKMYTGSKTT